MVGIVVNANDYTGKDINSQKMSGAVGTGLATGRCKQTSSFSVEAQRLAYVAGPLGAVAEARKSINHKILCVLSTLGIAHLTEEAFHPMYIPIVLIV